MQKQVFDQKLNEGLRNLRILERDLIMSLNEYPLIVRNQHQQNTQVALTLYAEAAGIPDPQTVLVEYSLESQAKKLYSEIEKLLIPEPKMNMNFINSLKENSNKMLQVLIEKRSLADRLMQKALEMRKTRLEIEVKSLLKSISLNSSKNSYF